MVTGERRIGIRCEAGEENRWIIECAGGEKEDYSGRVRSVGWELEGVLVGVGESRPFEKWGFLS